MKKLTKRISLLLAVVFVLTGVLTAGCTTAFAATKLTYPKKVRISPGSLWNQDIRINLPGAKYNVTNIKHSNKLTVKITRENHDHRWGDDEGYVYLSLYAKKSGKYQVTFDVVDAKKKVVAKGKKVTVFCKADSPIKKVTLGGKEISYSTLLKGKKGKLNVVMNNGYKLKKIAVVTRVKDKKTGESKEQTKYVNNKATIKYGTVPYQYVDKRDDQDYFADSWAKYMFADTEIHITYIDKYTKAETTASYSARKLV